MRELSVLGTIIICVGLIAIGFWAWPNYQVYQQQLAGEAEFKRAEQNRKIKIEEAKAYKESAQLLSDAEIIRAEGVAKANEIIGAGLKGHEEYLRYLWIQNLHGDGSQPQVIYVPTEAGLPILEAQRFK